MADDPALLAADNNLRGYVDEARMLLGKVLDDRLPATAEAIADHLEPLNIKELQAVLALADLLRHADQA